MTPAQELEEMLVLAIRWDKPDILQEVLQRAERTAKWFAKAIDSALVVAMVKNKPECVHVLIEHGGDITDLAVDRQFLRKHGPKAPA
eukprot:CAMPEP_0181331432 /NCGR_PEP_ID=MMETSP1101-20121128/24493_1 /TAXON_ID=46948 /ORGANISM="Rhodomonas abbreviata, Strain Caron Lab Isolate" /LENGTH=86 /DNA_ID=CAMNT_0023440881 /DNA_START=25 /DNA_END=282 /DNA_ORIENTATION=+